MNELACSPIPPAFQRAQRSIGSWFPESPDAFCSVSSYGRGRKPVTAGGGVLYFIPGPSIPLIVIDAGLLADESRSLAGAMDGLEVRVP